MQVHLSSTLSTAYLPGVLDSFSIRLLTFTHSLLAHNPPTPYQLRGGAREASTLTAEAGLFYNAITVITPVGLSYCVKAKENRISGALVPL